MLMQRRGVKEEEALTARKRKRDSIRCMMDARPLDETAAGSLSATRDLMSGLRGLAPKQKLREVHMYP